MSKRNQYLPAALRSTADDSVIDSGDEKPQNEKMAKKIIGRKQRVKGGYTIALAGYALFASLFASSLNPISFYAASGMFLASGVAYILKGATVNDRLKSDTYKRLNMALGFYGLIGIFARGTLVKSTLVRNVWTGLSFVTLVNSIKGYGYGLKGWELAKVNPIPELINGTKSYISTLFKIPNWKSGGYLLATLFFGLLKVSKMLQIFQLVSLKEWGFTLSSYLFRYGKLMMLSTLAFTLKDAADRDRLNGTTFKQLNGLVAIASATMIAYSFERSLRFDGFSALFVSVLCAYNWFSNK